MHAQVGEQDIAKVTKKMKGTFKVDAYTEENVEFLGEVTEIAFVPTTSPIRAGDFTSGTGPVTYTVTLKVLPSKNLETHPLKSGLTANVDLMVREVKHVLRVPNLALNFLPDNPTAEENRRRSERATTNWKPLWVWKGNGVREMIFVQTGANDGNRTEIKEIDGQLTEGMEVIVENPPRPENSGGLFNLPRLKVL
jgi:HlyD family secretion protein